MSARHRYGPAGYRLVKMARALAVLALTCVTTLVLATLASFYQGSGSVGAHGPAERTVQAAVQDCRRTGPLSEPASVTTARRPAAGGSSTIPRYGLSAVPLIFLAMWVFFFALAAVLGAPRHIVFGSWWIRKVLKRRNV